ncbi:WLM-domain-containing protein [Atractiella rhizophila]|nr:WLM-domain-containing protein [Atractiella rhizophila]
MPGGFERINEREANPNKHFAFISEQKGWPNAEEARKILRALVALFNPVMKEHGLWVTSLDEHEWNPQWAGKNWNAGEKIELVIRRPNGVFLPPQMLVFVMCHELAHCKQMNHGPDFQALNAQIRQQVRDLQARGYTGDGLWSQGHVLGTGTVDGQGILLGEMPANICGSKARVRKAKGKGKELRSTKKRRRKDPRAFKSEGSKMGDKDDEHAGFRKKAASKTGREKAALAAQRRLALLTGSKVPSTSNEKLDCSPPLSSEDEEEDYEYEDLEGEGGEGEYQEIIEVLRSCGNLVEQTPSAKSKGENRKRGPGQGMEREHSPPDMRSTAASIIPKANKRMRVASSDENGEGQEVLRKKVRATKNRDKEHRGLDNGEEGAKDESFKLLPSPGPSASGHFKSQRVQGEKGTHEPSSALSQPLTDTSTSPSAYHAQDSVDADTLHSLYGKYGGEMEWTCPLCTLRNHVDLGRCEACGESRQVGIR